MREKWDSLSLCDKTETVSLSSEHRYQKYIIGMWLEHKEEKQKKILNKDNGIYQAQLNHD